MKKKPCAKPRCRPCKGTGWVPYTKVDDYEDFIIRESGAHPCRACGGSGLHVPKRRA